MKSVIIKNPKREEVFPILMQYKDTNEIILVTGKVLDDYRGVLVYAPFTSPYYGKNVMYFDDFDLWSGTELEVFDGTIQLSN